MVKILLALIMVLFLFFSSYGMRADLPYSRVATEEQQIKLALKFGTGDLNPHHFGHPPFFAYVLFLLYGVTFLIGKALGIFKTVLDYQRLYFTDPTVFYMIARSIILVLATLSIAILYSIGKKLFDRQISLIASVFVAFSVVNIKWAHYASPDIPMLFLSLSSFYFMVRIFQEGLLRDYVLAGLLAGLAVATKYNAGLLIIPILVAHCLSSEKNRGIKGLFDRRLITAFLCVTLGFLLGCPFALLDYKTFLTGTGVAGSGIITGAVGQIIIAQDYNFPSWKVDKLGWLYILTDTLPFGLGIPLTILAISGVLYSLYRHKREDYLLLSLIFISYVLIGSWHIIKPRYFIYIFPLVLLLGARVLVEILSKVKFLKSLKTYAIGLTTSLLILMPLSQVIKFDLLVSKKPVYVEAKGWIESNIPPGSSIATLVGIPLVPNEKSINRKLQEIRDKKIGEGIRLKYLSKHLKSFPVTYNLIELPYPWREDYDDEDFNFHGQVEKGVKYFIFTQEMEEYLAEPERYKVQVHYFNLVKQKCRLIKEFRAPRVRVEPGFLSDQEYVQIYRYKE